MSKYILAVTAALLGVAGCASQPQSASEPQASASSSSSQQTVMATDAQGPSQAELAAYAGAHQYPATQPAKTDLRAAAIVVPDQGIIKIYNFGTEPIRDADVWVNQSFVRHVNAISPGSSVAIRLSNLYNALGQQLSARGEHVNLVQIQEDHTVHTLMGPAAQ